MLTLHAASAGLSNSKTIGVQQGEEGGIAVTLTHAKNSGKPAKRAHTTTSKKSFQRNAASLGKIAAGTRPDLKARFCRLSCRMRPSAPEISSGLQHGWPPHPILMLVYTPA